MGFFQLISGIFVGTPIAFYRVMTKNSISRTALCGLVATLATSCGNYMGRSQVAPVSSGGVNYGTPADLSALSGSGTSTVGSYTCPNSPNVLPTGDTTYSDAGKYTVCTHASVAANILIHGTTRGSTSICVFPVQYVDSTHVYFKPDLSTGLPMMSCASTTGTTATNGVAMGFSGVNYNAVFIVDDTDKSTMQACLANAQPGGCPLYSYGKFR